MSRLPGMGLLLGMGLLWSATVGHAGAEDGERPVYPHKSVQRQEFGVGAQSYWLFEPADPTPERAPVVVFHHGWFAVNPGVYGAWIEHLVKSGRIVIFPRYQNDVATLPNDFLPNALAAVRDAFDVLETSTKHVRPDRDKFAVIGHSAGGTLAAQLAAVARVHGLPTPRAVVSLMPGEVTARPYPSLADIPAETLLVVIVAADDVVVGDLRARQIFQEAVAVPSERKKFVLYRTDLHGTPRLIADHLAPAGYSQALDSGDGIMRGFQIVTADVNPLDRNGFWRVTDATLDAGFQGRTLDEATEKGALFRRLGYWSDGRAVLAPLVGDDLAAIPRIYPTNGLKLIDWSPRVSAAPDREASRR